MTISIKETYKDFSLFLKNPVDQPDPIQSKQRKVNRLLSILVIEIPIIVIIWAIIYGIEKLGLINTEQHKLEILFQQSPLWKFVLLGVIVNPFIEELIFRYYLRLKPNILANCPILSVSALGKRNKKKVGIYITNFWVNKFRIVFFFSTLLFAYFHLLNYELSSTVLLLAPILIAPQFIVGLFLGYLRIKYNLILGFFMHAIHNAFFILVSLFFINFG